MYRTCFLAGAAAPCLPLAVPAGAQTRETSPPGAPARSTTAHASAEIERTPGGVEVVPGTASRNTPVQTIKDVLQYVPGVIVKPRMGDDARLSIRGSGLSRACGVRGITLTIDGIPMNTSDGLRGFFKVDPGACRYVEAALNADLPRSALAAGDILAITAAYTYSDFFLRDDSRYGDNELPGIPYHYLRAEAFYRHPSGIYAGPSVKWAPGPYFADNADSLTVAPYALPGGKLGYDHGGRWSACAEGRNPTRKHYISTVAITGVASATSEILNPGVRRAVFGGRRYCS